MKKWLFSLVIAALALAQPISVAAWWQSVQQVSSASPVTFSITLTDSKSDSGGGSSITYTVGGNSSGNAPDIGATPTGAEFRVIALAIMSRQPAPVTVTGVTIGGITATQVPGAIGTASSAILSDLWYASVPLGTTAAVAINYGSSTLESQIAVYRIISSTATPFGTGSSTSNGSNNTLALGGVANPTGGALLFAFAMAGGCGATTTWTSTGTNPVKDFSGAGCTSRILSAAHDTANAGTTPTTTVANTGGVTAVALSIAPVSP